jgi:hypothetical protein
MIECSRSVKHRLTCLICCGCQLLALGKVRYVPPNSEVAVDCYGLSSPTKLLLTVFMVFLKCVDYLTLHIVLHSCQQHHILADIPCI